MTDKTNRQKTSTILILTILLISSCNQFYGASPLVPLPASTSTPLLESTTTPSPSLFKPGDPTATPLGSEITDPNYIKGVEAFFDKDYETTIILMSLVIEANLDLAPPYRYRSGAFALLGECAAGLADAEKAVSLAPDYAAAWAVRGVSYACLGNEEQQLKDYEKALSIDPSLSFVRHNLGVYYYQKGDYEKSYAEYSLSVAIDPTRSASWSGRAEALIKLIRYEECITSATKAIDLNPEEWLAYTERAYCRTVIGDNSGAIKDYQVFIENYDADDTATWYSLGTAQYHVGLNDEAEISLTKALELDPFYYQANINRGLVYKELGRYDEALADFNRALEFGDIPAAFSGRGSVYYFLGRYDEAIADLELASQMMPNRPTSYCFLALTYFELGRYQDTLDAASILNQVEHDCGGQRLLEYQARSYYALGDYEQAILYIDRAVAMEPYKMGIYYQGIIYDDAGKDEQAIFFLEQFLGYLPDESIFATEIADVKARLAKLKP